LFTEAELDESQMLIAIFLKISGATIHCRSLPFPNLSQEAALQRVRGHWCYEGGKRLLRLTSSFFFEKTVEIGQLFKIGDLQVLEIDQKRPL